MAAWGNTFAAAGVIVTVRSGLSARLEVGIAGIPDRVGHVDCEMAFVGGLRYLARPVRSGQADSGPER
ncbi:MAG: hypothetical protein OXC01_17550 [Immundisolibacterales bacterium]|nr:hypothetical protein [Immundisolibacterales bacterium]